MDRQQMLELLLASQQKAKAITETDREERKAEKKADQEDLKRMMTEMKAMVDGNEAKTRSIFDAWLTDLKDGRNEPTTCREATETEPNPGMVQSLQEQQKIPKDDPAVKPVGAPRKRRRVSNLAPSEEEGKDRGK
jgi:hypothetical protein